MRDDTNCGEMTPAMQEPYAKRSSLGLPRHDGQEVRIKGVPALCRRRRRSSSVSRLGDWSRFAVRFPRRLT